MCQEMSAAESFLFWVHAFCAAEALCSTVPLGKLRLQMLRVFIGAVAKASRQAPLMRRRKKPCNSECVIFSWSCPFGCLSFELHPDCKGCARQVLREGSVAAADAGALVPLIEEELDQLRHPLPRRSARQQSGLPPVSARAQARDVLMLQVLYLCLWGAAVLVWNMHSISRCPLQCWVQKRPL